MGYHNEERPDYFDPSEEGRCRLCAMDVEGLDSGLCEDCHEATVADGMDDVDVAIGAYWAWNHGHGGQSSAEYEALCQSPYSPGMSESGPTPGSDAEVYYARLLRARGMEPEVEEYDDASCIL